MLVKFDYSENREKYTAEEIVVQLIALCNEFKNIRDYENVNRAWYAAFSQTYYANAIAGNNFKFDFTIEADWEDNSYYYDLLVMEVGGIQANIPVPLVNQQVWIELVYLGGAVTKKDREQHERKYIESHEMYNEALKQELEAIIDGQHIDIKWYSSEDNQWQLDN